MYCVLLMEGFSYRNDHFRFLLEKELVAYQSYDLRYNTYEGNSLGQLGYNYHACTLIKHAVRQICEAGWRPCYYSCT